VAVATEKADDGLARFVLLALVATPVSIATALWLTQDIWQQTESRPLMLLALGVFIFFALPGLVALVSGRC
jgi:hypothetical protein